MEILAGPNSVDQLQGYSVMLAVGLLLTIVLKLVENQGLKLTVYPSKDINIRLTSTMSRAHGEV